MKSNLTIPELVAIAHDNAIDKGWHDEERSVGENIALMHSELSEALEDHRNGHEVTEIWYEYKHPTFGLLAHKSATMDWGGEQHLGKPCGIPTELADVVIRIFDFCGAHSIDLEAAVVQKMRYNETRPARHGGKVL